MRIIGVGNSDRGDDAAGLLVARRLRELGFDAREITDPLSLIDAWDRSADVVLVDAVITGASAGEVFRWDAGSLPTESTAFRFSTHGVSVLEVFRLATAIGKAPRTLVVFGIEGSCFDHGTSPGAAVQDAIDGLVRRLSTAARDKLLVNQP